MPKYIVHFFLILLTASAVHELYFLLYAPINVPDIPDKNNWASGSPKRDDESIKPFKINVDDSVLDDLKQRLSMELRVQPSLEETNFEYGFHSEQLRKIVEFWQSPAYNWREREQQLNSLPQFTTQISGLKVHFIHEKPQNVPANVTVLPLLLLHGWPGSIKEFYELIPILIRVDHERDFVFEIVSPSLPGFAFSEASHKPGLNPAHVAAMFRQLMLRLGHSKFYVQGGDWGAIIGADLSALYPDNVAGFHSTMCAVNTPVANMYLLAASVLPGLLVDNDIARTLFPLPDLISNLILESGYLHIQATKPDTVGVSLNNSPAGLAAYILEKFSTWTDAAHRNLPDGGLTRKFKLEDLLDNVMLYWISGSITSSMRIYTECFRSDYSSQNWDRVAVHVPTMCTQFPNELMRLPDIILRLKYKQLLPTILPPPETPMYLAVRPLRGGHFAAFEEPFLLAHSIVRAIEMFRSQNETDN